VEVVRFANVSLDLFFYKDYEFVTSSFSSLGEDLKYELGKTCGSISKTRLQCWLEDIWIDEVGMEMWVQLTIAGV
jgi:hypothetical protein